MGNASAREAAGERNGADDCNNNNLGMMRAQGLDSSAVAMGINSNNRYDNHMTTSTLSATPFLFAPQVPVAPLGVLNGPAIPNWQSDPRGVEEIPVEQGFPSIISWNYGGNSVAIEGSWDNWSSRKLLQRCGKDHSIMVVLQSGIYHYKFVVDGEWRYAADLPHQVDETGEVCNILDVNDYVPENPESISEFEGPASPEASYGQAFPAEDDFAKEPAAVPPQLHLTVLDRVEGGGPKPQHVVLNHLFIEKGWASQSLVALGMTHRYQAKYVTVVLYKPLRR